MIDPEILKRAEAHGHLFRRSDVLDAGVHPTQLRAWVKERHCRPVIRGIYSTSWAAPQWEGKLLELTQAMLLSNPGVAAAGRSALVLHGIATYGVNYERAQGVRTNACATRSTESVIIRRPLVPPETLKVGSWLSVEPAWAVVDVARDAGVEAGVVSADSALRQELVTPAALSKVIGAHPRSHRIGRAGRVLELMDSLSESPGETRTRLILGQAGIELEPQFQITVDGQVVARADFRVRGTKVLVEFDGMVKYRGADGPKALEEEKVREDMLRRLGWCIVRIVWADLEQPALVVARVEAALNS